jgi:hypothetical protein
MEKNMVNMETANIKVSTIKDEYLHECIMSEIYKA